MVLLATFWWVKAESATPFDPTKKSGVTSSFVGDTLIFTNHNTDKDVSVTFKIEYWKDNNFWKVRKQERVEIGRGGTATVKVIRPGNVPISALGAAIISGVHKKMSP